LYNKKGTVFHASTKKKSYYNFKKKISLFNNLNSTVTFFNFFSQFPPKFGKDYKCIQAIKILEADLNTLIEQSTMLIEQSH